MELEQDRAESGETGADPRLFVSGIERAMRVMEAFDAGQQRLSLADISTRTGLGRSAAQRIVYTLHHLGYLHREADERFYSISYRMVDLCRGLIGRESPARRLLPLLQDLAEKTGETTAWVQLEGDKIVVLQSVLSTHFSHVNLSVGQHFAALPSSSGQALLAHADPALAEGLLQDAAAPVRARLPFATPEEMHGHFAAIRAAGYALTGKDEDLYSVSLSAPVFGPTGAALGAINLSVVESRFPKDTVGARLSSLLLRAARDATALLSR